MKYAFVKGAEILEFHFTDDRENKSFRDHKVSLTLHEVKILIKELKRIREILGSSNKKPTETEISNNHQISFRRAVYPVRDLKRGEVIIENDITVLRPLQGLDARYFYDLIGRRVLKDIFAYQVLDKSYFSTK